MMEKNGLRIKRKCPIILRQAFMLKELNAEYSRNLLHAKKK